MVSLFDLVGLGDVSGIDMLFAASALVGGILFVLYFFLLMIGGIATDIFDGLFGIDVDWVPMRRSRLLRSRG